MQLGGTRFKKLSDTEKERRQANNLCLYCGEPNHRAQDCPKRVTGSRSAYSAHVATASPLPTNGSPANQAEKVRDRRLGHCPRCNSSLLAMPHVPDSVSHI